uniref:Uncharacterized protein n=1 Tax=Hanusia phi TaxID=3032 RepID=A0A7S0NE72_9CRYP
MVKDMGGDASRLVNDLFESTCNCNADTHSLRPEDHTKQDRSDRGKEYQKIRQDYLNSLIDTAKADRPSTTLSQRKLLDHVHVLSEDDPMHGIIAKRKESDLHNQKKKTGQNANSQDTYAEVLDAIHAYRNDASLDNFEQRSKELKELKRKVLAEHDRRLKEHERRMREGSPYS